MYESEIIKRNYPEQNSDDGSVVKGEVWWN